MAGSIYAETQPTEAALTLDVLDLPVGTFVAWTTTRSQIRCRIQAIKAPFMAPNVSRCVLLE